jgi:CIC family chloride channel protein
MLPSGVRNAQNRLLAPESVYTIKLVSRGHTIPRVRHANMFLVRRARDIMVEMSASRPLRPALKPSSGPKRRQGGCAVSW